ncbi:MAG TPA: ABC transporter permease [Mycobacteriales bacterium]|nr:ABC transporter permease [Mycobacteriales bacterium]
MASPAGEAPTDLAAQRARRLAALPLEPAAPRAGFLHGTAQSVRDVVAYRELLGLLVRRELKARYKDSSLGFLWSLIHPLAQLLIYYVALGKFLGAERAIPDYAIFVFTGLTGWQLFTEIVNGGTGSILANGGLVKKIYLPREVFPLSVVGSALFSVAIQLGILVVATVLVGKPPTGAGLLYAPPALVVLLVYATAFAFLLSALNVYLRDIQYLVQIALMVMFWTAPIVYSWAQVHAALGEGLAATLYLSNPLAVATLALQRCFWEPGRTGAGLFPDGLGWHLAAALAVGLVVLWLCQRVFALLQDNFAQEL